MWRGYEGEKKSGETQQNTTAVKSENHTEMEKTKDTVAEITHTAVRIEITTAGKCETNAKMKINTYTAMKCETNSKMRSSSHTATAGMSEIHTGRKGVIHTAWRCESQTTKMRMRMITAPATIASETAVSESTAYRTVPTTANQPRTTTTKQDN